MLFISHSTLDKPYAEDLKRRLLARGYTDQQIFLDSDADSGIGAGDEWERKLRSHLRRCVALVAICSENFDQSGWCFAEVVRTRDRNKPIFPVFIQDCSIRSPLHDRQAVSVWKEGEDAAYARLFTALEKARLGPTDFFVWEEGECPYPGLPAFEEKFAGVYFGRDQEIDDIREQLGDMRARGLPRFLLITGGSGSGKSSLLKAGLLPRLKHKAAAQQWLVLPVLRFSHSADETFDHLAANVSVSFPVGSPQHGDWEVIRPQLGPDSDTSGFGKILLGLATQRGCPDATVLLPIDQFEEMLVPAAEGFIRFLTTLCSRRNDRLLVTGTMRSDYLDAYGNHTGTPKGNYLLPFVLGPFPEERIGEVILKPAECAGVEIRGDLLERLKKDAAGESLPLLAFALEKLYRKHAGDNLLELSEYEDLGGMVGAIQECVASVEKEIAFDAASTASLRRCFIQHLVHINDKGLPIRKTARWNDLDPAVLPILKAFIDERLLTSSRHEDKQDPAKSFLTVEVAHEAIFTAWKELAAWIAKSVDIIRWRQSVQRDRNENAGWTGLTSAQLATARNWPKTRKDELADREVKWIDDGIRQQKLKRTAAITAFVIVLIAAGIAIWQYRKASKKEAEALGHAETAREEKETARKEKENAVSAREEAERVSRRNLAQRLAFDAEFILPRAPGQAAARAAEALQITLDADGKSPPEVRAAVNRILATASGRSYRGIRRQSAASAIFDRSETFVAVSGWPGVVEVRDLSKPAAQSLVHFIRDDEEGNELALVAFDSTGTHLVTYREKSDTAAASAMVWKLEKGQKDVDQKSPLNPKETFTSLVASRDNRWLAAAGSGGIFIYNLQDISKGSEERVLAYREKNPVTVLQFSDDGNLLLAGSRNCWVQIWDLTSGKPEPCACFRDQKPPGDSDEEEVEPIRVLEISADRSALVTDGQDRVNLWNLGQDYLPQGAPRLLADEVGLTSADFVRDEDGSTFLVALTDYEVIRWRLGKEVGGHGVGESMFKLDEIAAPSFAVGSSAARAISADGKTLAVCCEDGAVRIVNTMPGPWRNVEVRGGDGEWEFLKYSPSGRWLLSGSDEAFHLWKYEDGLWPVPMAFGKPGSSYWRSRMSGGGSLAALWEGNSLEIWDFGKVESAKHLFSLAAPFQEDPFTDAMHHVSPENVVISRDGKWLVVRSADEKETSLVLPSDPARRSDSFEIPVAIGDSWEGARFSPDSRWLLVESESGSFLHDLQRPKAQASALGRFVEDCFFVFSEDGNWLFMGLKSMGLKSEGQPPGAVLWQLGSGEAPPAEHQIGEKGQSVTWAGFSADGLWLAWSVQPVSDSSPGPLADSLLSDLKLIRLKQAPSQVQGLGPVNAEFSAHPEFSPDGRWLLASGKHDQAELWDLKSGGKEAKPTAGDIMVAEMSSARFSPDSKSIILQRHSNLELWQWDDSGGKFLRKGELSDRSLQGPRFLSEISPNAPAFFAPDSKLAAIVGGDSQSLDLWHLSDGEAGFKAVQLKFGYPQILDLKFSADSSTLYVLSSTVRSGPVNGKQGSQIIAFDVNPPRGEIVGEQVFVSEDKRVQAFQVSENPGMLLVTGSVLHVWPLLDRQMLLAKLQDLAGRNMSWGEWTAADLPGPFHKTFPDFPVDDSALEAWATRLDRGDPRPMGVDAPQIVKWAKEADFSYTSGVIALSLAEQGHGELALEMVEAALKHDPDDPLDRATRGIARGLTGDLKGAREDLQFSVENPPEGLIFSRHDPESWKSWVEELNAGRNPFADGYPKESP